MPGIRKQIVPVFVVCLLAGCAAQRYQPSPIVAAKTASQLESRNLADDGLRSFIEKNLGQSAQWPLKTWGLQKLSLAALYFNPALDVARARVARADAAVVTAGARPNPTLGISPGIPSPYLLTLDFAIPIETAGKRGYRVQSARNLDEAARLDLADSAWTVLGSIRLALLNYLLASRNLEVAGSEEQVRADQVNILERIILPGRFPDSMSIWPGLNSQKPKWRCARRKAKFTRREPLWLLRLASPWRAFRTRSSIGRTWRRRRLQKPFPRRTFNATRS